MPPFEIIRCKKIDKVLPKRLKYEKSTTNKQEFENVLTVGAIFK